MPRSTPLGRLDSDPEADNGSVDRRDDEETGVISLPTINPFAGSARRGSPNRRRPPPSQPQDDDQDDEEEGVISLPTVNRFARGNHSGRGNPRRNRHPPEDDDQRRDRDRDDEEEGVISLPSVNPFARDSGSRGNSGRNPNTNTGRQRASRPRPPARPEVVSDPESETKSDQELDSGEEDPASPALRRRAGAVPSHSRLFR
ncbi:hypothetical protein RhiLY_11322 [Ceratobasidium sp. AG-Ba]|nr:hypothetical protein RhiLY_11322 [Ceratobasidium sp. AG-Ba]